MSDDFYQQCAIQGMFHLATMQMSAEKLSFRAFGARFAE